jgi:sugar lactone lactonase YvrE
MQSPLLGYAAQQSPPELRAILGVPGAAVFSDPLSLPRRTMRLRLAPGQQYAIIERAQEDPAVLLLNGTETGGIAVIPGAVRALDSVSFSPSGRSAVLISQGLGRLQVITGLPQAPQLAKDIDLRLLPELPDNAAVSDDGGSVLFSSAGAVYLVLPDGSATIVLSVTPTASIAFLPASTTAAIGDPGTGSLYLFQRLAGGTVASLLASGLPGLGQVAASGDGKMLYVTDTQSQRIWSVNVASGAVGQFDLQVSASKLDRLRNADTFLISSEPGLPGWIFFRQGEDARTVFVPAVPRHLRRSPERVVNLK